MILYDFVKIPQSFFCSKKTTAPSSEGACVCAKFSTCYILKVIINTSIPTAAASHRPTVGDINLIYEQAMNFGQYCVQTSEKFNTK